MACRQFNSAIIEPEISISAQKLNNIINKCYNDKMSEKVIIQIRK